MTETNFDQAAALPKEEVSIRQCFADAHVMLRGKWGKSIGTMLILFFCLNLINLTIGHLFPRGVGIGILCNAIVVLACARFFFVAMRGEWPTLDAVEFAFDRFGTILAAFMLIFLYVFAGFLLLIIPGILFALNCSMVYFVLSEDRRMTAREAIRRSKAMMYGNRWKYFCLSFVIGLLFALPLAVLGLTTVFCFGLEVFLPGAFSIGTLVFQLVSLVISLFYSIYFYSVSAAFYLRIRPEALAEVEPPETPYAGMPKLRTALLALLVIVAGYGTHLNQQSTIRRAEEASLRNSAAQIIDHHKYAAPTSTKAVPVVAETFPAHLYVEGDWKKLDNPARTPVLIELPYRRGTDDFLVIDAGGTLHRYKFEPGVSERANYFDVIYADFDCSDKMKFELEAMATPVFEKTKKPSRW